MSTFRPRTVHCPSCAAPFPVTILKGLHITRLPEVRQTILDGSFHRVACPGCNAGLRLEEPGVVYTDFERGHYVVVETVQPRRDLQTTLQSHVEVFEEGFVRAPEVARSLGRSLTHRLVFGLGALREKLRLWDAGLDDRVVEAVKLDLLGPEAGRGDELLRFSALLAPGCLMFARLVRPEGRAPMLPDGSVAVPEDALTGHVTAPITLFERRAERPEGIAADYPWLLDPWLVDAHDGHPDRVGRTPEGGHRAAR